jgi:hypothetical protein
VARCHQLAQRIKGHCRHKIDKVAANAPAISHSEGSSPGLPSRRFGPTSSPNEET